MGNNEGTFPNSSSSVCSIFEMRTLLVRTGSTESFDYKDSKPKGFCKKIGKIIQSHCSTPEEREKNKCDNHEKSFAKYCGSGASDYLNTIGIGILPHNLLGGGTNIIGGNQNAFGGGNQQTSIG